jgi:hypothetical protein
MHMYDMSSLTEMQKLQWNMTAAVQDIGLHYL